MLTQCTWCGRVSKAVEDSLGYYRTHHAESSVPAELQRDLLEEAYSPDELHAAARLKCNRLAAIERDGRSLIAHPVGQAGERLCLSRLSKSSGGQFEVLPHRSPYWISV